MDFVLRLDKLVKCRSQSAAEVTTGSTRRPALDTVLLTPAGEYAFILRSFGFSSCYHVTRRLVETRNHCDTDSTISFVYVLYQEYSWRSESMARRMSIDNCTKFLLENGK